MPGLSESDLEDLSDNEIVDLADEYENGGTGEESEEEPSGENQNGNESEETESPVDLNELEEARQVLISAGLTNKQLQGLKDEEIIELAKEYKKQKGNEPEEPVPRRSTA